MDRHRFSHDEPALADASTSSVANDADLAEVDLLEADTSDLDGLDAADDAETESPSSVDPAAAAAAPAGPHKRDLIAGLEKGLMVIEAFDQQRPRLTITQVAARTGLTRAAARRYLITLAHLGYVTHDRKMFSLTPRVLRLGQSYMHSAQLPRIVQPELQRLSAILQESTSASVLEDEDVVCIASHYVSRTSTNAVHPGTRVPAFCAASGRVLVSALADDVLDAWIDRQTLEPLTPQTVTTTEGLRREIERVRAQGYSAIDQELETGLRTLAVPLRNYRGQVVASVTIGAHGSRVPMNQWVTECLPMLLQTQQELRSLL
jgi:IclR family pca regulon transcriptional regulator